MLCRENMEKYTEIQKLKAAIGESSGSKQKADKNFSDDEYLLGRYDLLEKYGLKEMDEKDIEELLGVYDRDSLNNREIENMERILSRKIYQATLSISSIKGAAVEVFIENHEELYGIVNIIVEYEPKSFLDKIRGVSNNMEAETIEIARIEISEIFKSHPEIVPNIEIKVDSL